MMSSDPKTWTSTQYEGFVMMMAAAGDLEMRIEEKRPIIDKVGADFGNLLNLFRSMNDAERMNAVISGKATHIKSDQDSERLLKEVKEVFMADDDFADIERGIMSLFKKIF